MQLVDANKNKVGSGNAEYLCIIPVPLPPQNPGIQYDDEMIFLISEANRCIGRLDEVPNVVAEIENYAVRTKLALRFIVLRSAYC